MKTHAIKTHHAQSSWQNTANSQYVSNLQSKQAISFGQFATGQYTLKSALAQNNLSQANTQKSSWFGKVIGLPAYYWVLISQLFVVVPHIVHVPVWLVVFAIFSIVAQLPRIKARIRGNKPKRLRRLYQGVQIVSFIAGLAGLWLTYQTAFGVDVAVAFLLLCLIGKLWELYKRRDAYVVLNLSLFVVASLFLMEQGLFTTLQAVTGVMMVIMALVALNDDGNYRGEGRLRTLGFLTLASVPLLVVLFLFFPRLPPLWSVQLASQRATTGVSDSMSPGDFASLSQSTELAFRVEFENQRPAMSQMYWRGLIFSDFDGVTWRPTRGSNNVWGQDTGQEPSWYLDAINSLSASQKNQGQNYRVIFEPSQQQWLFGLDYPSSKSIEKRGIGLTADFTLRYWQPIAQQLRYQVQSYPQMQINPELSKWQRQINLALPDEGNSQSRQLAQQLFTQAGRDPERYINAIRQWINQGAFRYTLSPPPLGDNRIDEFLFGSQAGFCEHYSSSFTFLMRAAGIPARVVTGYQGGELGRNGQVWEVRQMDAHAWSEVWLEGQGWVRVDPTAFVAPERVEQGMNAITQQQGAEMFGTGAGGQLSYQQFRMLQTLRRLSDQASYYWQRDVVGYDQDSQSSALWKWFNITNIMQQVMVMLVGFVLILAVIGFAIWYRRRKIWHPVDLPLVKLSKRLKKSDSSLAYHDNEGILAWLQRLEQQMDKPQAKLTVRDVQQTYRQLRYGRLSEQQQNDEDYQQALKILKQKVSNIRW